MGKDLMQDQEASEMMQLANDSLKRDLGEIMFNGPKSSLEETANTQPAILLHSMMLYRIFQRSHPQTVDKCATMLGHSLGEFSALCAAGTFTLKEAVELVAYRGQVMQEAVPLGKGGMIALMPIDPQTAQTICDDTAREMQGKGEFTLDVANINSADQIVLAGDVASLEVASRLAKQKGIRLIKRLDVSAPFHSKMMTPARRLFASKLATASMAPPRVQIVTNVSAQASHNVDQIRNELMHQISSPVRWNESISTCLDLGIDTFIEMGPGKVLTNLIAKQHPQVKCHSIDSLEKIKEFKDSA
eukprot:TRINITY_DN904_c0_g1_i1.p1 TRINITY_DN904_c0_g1~~TRINITY_DN904_c0_g1_i1.p1  ORF type:complete len:351 (-),score=90.78 TRINITY_DN904_c0_g1_i1:241-1146(-)